MSAAELRQAAALMRERAEAASDAWGAVRWTAGDLGWDDRQGSTYDVNAGSLLVAATGCEELSEHIASWHPAVALAVADWLDRIAWTWELDPDLKGRVGGDEALAVARAYLGSAS